MCFFSGDGVCCAAVCFVEEGWCVVVMLWCLDVLCGGACDVWWWCGVSWCVGVWLSVVWKGVLCGGGAVVCGDGVCCVVVLCGRGCCGAVVVLWCVCGGLVVRGVLACGCGLGGTGSCVVVALWCGDGAVSYTHLTLPTTKCV